MIPEMSQKELIFNLGCEAIQRGIHWFEAREIELIVDEFVDEHSFEDLQVIAKEVADEIRAYIEGS